MDIETLRRRIGEVLVLDVRYPNEWAAGHIESAVHVPEDDVYDHLPEFERSTPIVAVCRSGQRSQRVATLLRDEGFDAESLDGGMQAWAQQGLAFRATSGAPGVVAEPEEPADDRPEHLQQLQSTFLEVIFAVRDHFGDHEPSEDEVRAFLKDRLIAEGKTPEEADRFLDRDDT